MVRSCCVFVALIAGCGTRAPRSAPTEQPHAPAPADAAVTPSDSTQSSQPAVVVEPPRPRMPWVNPARCMSPCTYDPQAELVRVDEQGVADTAGPHLVHRSIEEPLRALVAAARAAGHKIKLESGYRSYEYQADLFKKTKQRGRAARPGHSEHQLGTVVDFRMPTTASIAWLGEHAVEHGFVLSYPDGKQRITGYRPEPWHFRYVGNELAQELRAKGWTLEEMFRERTEIGASGACSECPNAASRAPCGDITAFGRCDGNVLEWCYDGALAVVDCAASKQRCGRNKGAEQYDCISNKF